MSACSKIHGKQVRIKQKRADAFARDRTPIPMLNHGARNLGSNIAGWEYQRFPNGVAYAMVHAYPGPIKNN